MTDAGPSSETVASTHGLFGREGEAATVAATAQEVQATQQLMDALSRLTGPTLDALVDAAQRSGLELRNWPLWAVSQRNVQALELCKTLGLLEPGSAVLLAALRLSVSHNQENLVLDLAQRDPRNCVRRALPVQPNETQRAQALQSAQSEGLSPTLPVLNGVAVSWSAVKLSVDGCAQWPNKDRVQNAAAWERRDLWGNASYTLSTGFALPFREVWIPQVPSAANGEQQSTVSTVGECLELTQTFLDLSTVERASNETPEGERPDGSSWVLSWSAVQQEIAARATPVELAVLRGHSGLAAKLLKTLPLAQRPAQWQASLVVCWALSLEALYQESVRIHQNGRVGLQWPKAWKEHLELQAAECPIPSLWGVWGPGVPLRESTQQCVLQAKALESEDWPTQESSEHEERARGTLMRDAARGPTASGTTHWPWPVLFQVLVREPLPNEPSDALRETLLTNSLHLKEGDAHRAQECSVEGVGALAGGLLFWSELQSGVSNSECHQEWKSVHRAVETLLQQGAALLDPRPRQEPATRHPVGVEKKGPVTASVGEALHTQPMNKETVQNANANANAKSKVWVCPFTLAFVLSLRTQKEESMWQTQQWEALVSQLAAGFLERSEVLPVPQQRVCLRAVLTVLKEEAATEHPELRARWIPSITNADAVPEHSVASGSAASVCMKSIHPTASQNPGPKEGSFSSSKKSRTPLMGRSIFAWVKALESASGGAARHHIWSELREQMEPYGDAGLSYGLVRKISSSVWISVLERMELQEQVWAAQAMASRMPSNLTMLEEGVRRQGSASSSDPGRPNATTRTARRV